MANAIAVAVGGALGALARYWVGLELNNKGTVPWGTLTVNLVGSLLIGFLALWIAKRQLPETWSLLLVTGVLGGFTTFSAFSLENLQLLQDGKIALAFAYSLGSVTAGLLLAYAGFALAQRVAG